MREKSIYITKKQLLNVAIDSVRRHGNLKEFRKYVVAARESGLLNITDQNLNYFIDCNIDKMFGIGMREQEADTKHYHAQEMGIYRD